MGFLSLFAILATDNGIMHGGDQTDLLQAHLEFPAVPVFDAPDAYFVQVTGVSAGLPNLAFAAQDKDIIPVADIQGGDGFEVGGPWDVAVYEDGKGNIYAVVLARLADAIQIINITDSARPSAVSTIWNSDEIALDDPVALEVYDDGNTVYVMITTHNSDTFQIIDITDPASPSVAATLLHGSESALDGALGFDVYSDYSGNTYAIIVSHFSDTAQIIDITDPASPSAVATIRDGGNFALDGPGDVAVYDDGTAVYAIVAVYDTDRVQIIDITDPASPSAVITLQNDDDFELNKPWTVVVHEDVGATYAMVAARMGNAVQIIDITDPTSPLAAATLRNGEGFKAVAPVSFEIYEDANNDAYAILTALGGNTIQIVDITDPTSPFAVTTFRGSDDFELGGPTGVAIYEDISNDTYAILTGFSGNTVKIVQIDTGMPSPLDADTLGDDVSQKPTEQDAWEEEKISNDDDGGGGGCLIATAAYGTELAPQIQALRETRNNIVLSTESGSAFMQAFHHAYYSFSPTVADMQRQNDMFNAAVRALISPMVATLSIMTLADDGSEYAVVGLGVLVVTLNLGLYVGLPTLAGLLIRRHA